MQNEDSEPEISLGAPGDLAGAVSRRADQLDGLHDDCRSVMQHLGLSERRCAPLAKAASALRKFADKTADAAPAPNPEEDS